MTERDTGVVPTDAVCLGCDFRLRGLSGPSCPECGRSFDPNDTTTFGLSTSPTRWQRSARPPSVAGCLFVAGLCSWGLVGASGPARWEADWACLFTFVGIPLGIVAVATYLERLFASLRMVVQATEPPPEVRSRWRWLVMPVCVLLIVSCFIYPWPLMLRFRLSHSPVDAAVVDYRAGRIAGDQRVGLYYVGDVDGAAWSNRATVRFTTGASFIDLVGFEYDPLPGHPTTTLTMEVAPSWYTFED